MVTCPNCYSKNSDSASYCESCGQPLFKICGNCGSRVKPTSRFCPDCGTPIKNEIEEIPDKSFYVKGVSFKMKFVKGGSFMMGTREDDEVTQPDERPQHLVTLSDFFIGEMRVSAELWKAVIGYVPTSSLEENATIQGFTVHGGEYKPGYPVESPSFVESIGFIEKLNKITGQKFRLPTEAEWEYAARGGQKSKGYRYCGSNDYDEVSWSDWDSHPYKQKKPNELGLYDMCDHQGEWCQDYYDFNFYKRSPQFNPCNDIKSDQRVLRGGKSGKYCHFARPTFRNSASEKQRGGLISLRLALSI